MKKYQDYYIFKDAEAELTNWQSKFGGSVWEYLPKLNKYYLHLYHPNQADLNWKNEKVRDELVEVLKFWLDKGVKGFRFDVINVINKPSIMLDDNEGDGRRFYTDGPLVLTWLNEIFKKAGFDDSVITVGELSSTSIENANKYTNELSGSLNMAFNFHHLKLDYENEKKFTLGKMKFKELLLS